MSWIILIGQTFERLPKYFSEFIVMIDCNAIKSVGIFNQRLGKSWRIGLTAVHF
jgi:hypothetical protein